MLSWCGVLLLSSLPLFGIVVVDASGVVKASRVLSTMLILDGVDRRCVRVVEVEARRRPSSRRTSRSTLTLDGRVARVAPA